MFLKNLNNSIYLMVPYPEDGIKIIFEPKEIQSPAMVSHFCSRFVFGLLYYAVD
jgi:hypothetical protein